jgi:hypothetical protein
MNGIARVTDKRVKLIAALSRQMAKEARRLSETLDQWSTVSLEMLSRTVATAEVIVAKAGEYFEELEGRHEEGRQILADRVSR